MARALSDNPVTIPDVHSVYLGIDSLVMNIRPFDEINQFRTRCFISFASHQKRNLSLTQVLKLYVAAYQVGFPSHLPILFFDSLLISRFCFLLPFSSPDFVF